jgi:alkanesulfonate monooxygenase SsuD/methylene tetrahydromethanopterin reductase-like flavin-dependent oxidoreductase (luciferase family)
MRPVTISLQLFATRRAGATAAEVLDDLVARAVLADELGFGTVWLAEHHDTDWNLCSDPLTVLARLAGATSRIRLGAAVVNLGLHHPVRIAEQAALVNVLSHGRLELGLGKGFAAADYRKFGLESDDRDARFRANHDELLTLLRSTPETAAVPTWLSSSGHPRAVAVAAEHGHGLLLAAAGEKLVTLSAYVASLPVRPRLGLVRAVHTGPDAGTATRELRPYLDWYMVRMAELQPQVTSPPAEEVLDTFCVLGSGPECVARIDELCRAHGIGEFIGVPGIGGMDLETTARVLRELAAAMDRDLSRAG